MYAIRSYYVQRNVFAQETPDSYLAEIGIRLHRKIKTDEPVNHPVNAVLPGRRNNPANRKAGIRPLSVYNPIHYQEIPELFMDFICSLTGKSPSTTGRITSYNVCYTKLLRMQWPDQHPIKSEPKWWLRTSPSDAENWAANSPWWKASREFQLLFLTFL